MTREEKQKAIDALKISAPVIAVTQEEFNDYIQTLNQVMDWLEQEPTTKNDLGVDCVSRQFMYELGATCIATRNKKTGHLMALGMIEELPSVTPQLSSELEKNSKLEMIRDQLKSNLRGVEITLEVLVENDPLRPKMEGAKCTLEDCLELIDMVEPQESEE